jgi:hypothetical protein
MPAYVEGKKSYIMSACMQETWFCTEGGTKQLPLQNLFKIYYTISISGGAEFRGCKWHGVSNDLF